MEIKGEAWVIILPTREDDQLPSFEWDEEEPGFIEVMVQADTETKVWICMNQAFVTELNDAIDESYRKVKNG